MRRYHCCIHRNVKKRWRVRQPLRILNLPEWPTLSSVGSILRHRSRCLRGPRHLCAGGYHFFGEVASHPALRGLKSRSAPRRQLCSQTVYENSRWSSAGGSLLKKLPREIPRAPACRRTLPARRGGRTDQDSAALFPETVATKVLLAPAFHREGPATYRPDFFDMHGRSCAVSGLLEPAVRIEPNAFFAGLKRPPVMLNRSKPPATKGWNTARGVHISWP